MQDVDKKVYIHIAMIFMPIVFFTACDSLSAPPKGACVRGTGITALCGDDFTSANCEQFAGGTSFHEGKSCDDLGFDST